MANSNENPSDTQWNIFFRSLAKCESVSKACTKAKISRATAYRYKKTSWQIAARWQEATQTAVEYLEDHAVKRATLGVKRETVVYWQGTEVGRQIETRYSDTLLLALLGARDPRYRNNANDSYVQAELNAMLDRLQRVLTSEEYEKVIRTLAADDDDVIDAEPQQRLIGGNVHE